MPFIYDMPTGREPSQTYSHSDVELLKLLNAGYPITAVNEDSYAPRHHQLADVSEENSDDDFTMNRRYPHMSIDGRAYPPVPPQASTLPRPSDNWFAEDEVVPSIQAYEVPPAHYPSEGYYGTTAYPQASNGTIDDHYSLDAYDRVQPSWSPPNGWQAMSAAPLLHPRLVQLAERPITPHDTYRYPSSHNQHIYIAPAAPSIESVNHAFATWYASQVIGLLVTPGQYRPGVGGASDAIWGPGGREKEGWQRVGRIAPDYSKSWGRMGMTSTPAQAPRQVNRRRPELEPRDPWNVEWANAAQTSPTLVSFVLDLIQRMTITPTALVAAVWYLTGLGLHEGDGAKGVKLRTFLRECSSLEPEAVEKRVSALGLMLAGKWLDDNSFLTKSWNEVTTIPIKQLDRMERHALEDLHYSVFVPVSSWVDHVNKLYADLDGKVVADEVDLIVTPVIDQMVTEARIAEAGESCLPTTLANMERRLSTEALPAAADQAITRDWGTFARSYAHIGHEDGQYEKDFYYQEDSDEEMERAERGVDALVNDAEEEDEEFLDYDGAERWLPPMAEVHRTNSQSSDSRILSSPIDYQPEHHHRFVVHPMTLHHTYPHAEPEAEIYELPALDEYEVPMTRSRAVPDWTQDTDWSPRASYDYPLPSPIPSKYRPSPCCQQCKNGSSCNHVDRGYASSSKRYPLGMRSMNEYTDFDPYLEPGISVMQPPSLGVSSGNSGGNGHKRWGHSASHWQH